MNIINSDNQYQRLMEKYRENYGLPFRRFASDINANLPAGFGFQMGHWYAIYRGKYKPDYYAMWYLAQTGTGWVKEFASDTLTLLEGN